MPAGARKGESRRKGIPNKRSQDVVDLFDRLKFEPLEEVIALLRAEIKKTKMKRPPPFTMKPATIAKMYLALAEFRYPKRKAIEATVEAEIESDVTYVSEWGSRSEPSDADDT
jgi:uncharacterized small protein (DUF1192 family)